MLTSRHYGSLIEYMVRVHGIETDSHAEAYWRFMNMLFEDNEKLRGRESYGALHTRGEDVTPPKGKTYWHSSFSEKRLLTKYVELTDDEKRLYGVPEGRSRVRFIKRKMRERRWRDAITAKGDVISHLLGVMTLDEAEKLAGSYTLQAISTYQTLVLTNTMEKLPFRINNLNVYIDNENQRFEKTGRSRMALYVSTSVLSCGVDVDGTVTPVHRKAIIIHVEGEGEARFAKWVCKPSERLPVTMLGGALIGGELVPGYNSLREVEENLGAIREQAHAMKTLRILRGE